LVDFFLRKKPLPYATHAYGSKKNVLFFAWLLLASLLFLTLPTQAQQIGKESFDRLSVEDGLSQNAVNCIFQDSKGFIWLGTQDGLDRYDGYEFKSYKHNPKNTNSISDNFIWTIYEDKKGFLWVGTQNGLNRIDVIAGKIERFTHKANDKNALAHNKVYAILQDKKGNLWLGTEDGVSVLNPDKQTFKNYTFAYSVFNSPVHALYETKSGEIYVGTMGAGLQVFVPKTETFVLHPAYLPTLKNDFIRCIFEDKQSNFWIGTAQGIRKIDTNTQKITFFTHSLNDESLTNNNVSAITEDQSEHIWIGTMGGGVNRFVPKAYQSEEYEIVQYINDFYNPQSLSLNNVSSLLVDKSGILWVGTVGGGVSIHDYGKEKFHVHRLSAYTGTSVNNNMIWSISGDDDNIIWLGTGGGGLNRFEPKYGQYTYYTAENSSISDNHVISVAQSPSDANRLWVGTDHGLNELDKKTGKFKIYAANAEDTASLSDAHINSLYEANGFLWIGTSEGGLNSLNLKTGKFKSYKNDINLSHSISENTIETLIVDKQGYVWCGTTGGGLNRFDPKTEKFTIYKSKIEDQFSLSNNIVKCIYEEKSGNLWIGTNGGLNYFDRYKNIFIRYTTKDGLPHNTVQAIQQDDNDNVWVSTNRGISKFDAKNTKFLNFDGLDNLQGDVFNTESSYKTLAGELFFGGNNGFNTFFPESIDQNSYVPMVVMTNITVNGVSIFADSSANYPKIKGILNNTETLISSYNQNTISFDFVSLSFRHASKNMYECKLENFDKEWIKLGNDRSYTYKNLPAGDYIFKVKGSNNDGVWAKKMLSIKIKIRPPFWDTWWFRFLGAACFVGFVYWVYKLRIKQVEMQKEKLETIVEQRTAEIRNINGELQHKQAEVYAQKQDLERQKDVLEEAFKTISDKNDNILSSIRYAEKIQQVILPSVQVLSAAVPNNFVIFRPKDIVSGDFYWCKHIDNKVFLSVNDCTGHGVPGALMSMIGTTLLNEITEQKKIYSPAVILEELHIGVRLALKQDNNVNDDGMDVVLCLLEVTEQNRKKLTFAGAKRTLLVAAKRKNKETETNQVGEERGNEMGIEMDKQIEADICDVQGNCLYEVRGDKKAIGGRQKEVRRLFTNQDVPCLEGNMLYLVSDGFADQPNRKNEKFGSLLLKETLLQISPLDLAEQKVKLENILDTHQQNCPQRDDITLIGVRI
jgi:ligand-binding sensor domain-containing protein/serine phosphatase RsbU (regulator of sigma subunit)